KDLKKNFRPISGQTQKEALAKPFNQNGDSVSRIDDHIRAPLPPKTGPQAIDSAALTREPLPWSGRGQNRRWQLAGKMVDLAGIEPTTSPASRDASARFCCLLRSDGGPGRDRTDDLFHAMEARSQLRHRPTSLISIN